MRAIYKANIVKEVNQIVDEVTPEITKDMAEQELKAYKFGVAAVISVLDQYLNQQKEVVLVNDADCKYGEELLLSEFLKSVLED